MARRHGQDVGPPAVAEVFLVDDDGSYLPIDGGAGVAGADAPALHPGAEPADPSAPAPSPSASSPDDNVASAGGDGRGHRADRGRVPRWAVALGVLIGLVVGVVIGGVGAHRPRPEQPRPVQLTSDELPSSILGLPRSRASGPTDGDGSADGQPSTQRMPADAMRHMFEQMYGGPALFAVYGPQISGPQYRLTMVNGLRPQPPVASDSMIKDAGPVGMGSAVRVPGTRHTTCVARALWPVRQGSGADVEELRDKVRHMRGGHITCVRSEWARYFSIQLAYTGRSGHGPTAAEEAAKMASVVDRLWMSVLE